jgi:membrane protein DedA with SNARE-associated domain
VETFLHTIQSLDPWLVYTIVFAIAFAENIFPPLPSDIVVVIGGSLAVVGGVNVIGVLALATAGSIAGFVTMYFVGDWFGDHILEKGKISFIPVEGVRKVEEWFSRYGYWIIVANRFLAGTRAVVSFVAGMSELDLRKTIILCAVSSLAWNAVLVGSGYALGQQWERIGFYLVTYSQTVTAVLIVAVLLLVARYLYLRKRKRASS